jgi:hypothetical protein
MGQSIGQLHGSLMGWPVVLGFGGSSGNNMDCGKTLGQNPRVYL